MKFHFRRLVQFVIVLLCVAFAFSSCDNSKEPVQKRRGLTGLADVLNSEETDELILNIYYLSPYCITSYPFQMMDLRRNCRVLRRSDHIIIDGDHIIIDGDQLEEHEDSLRRLTPEAVVPLEGWNYLNARLGYTLETKEDGIILEVIFGTDNFLFVNDVPIEFNDVFYQVVKPFLPEKEQKDFEYCFEYGWVALLARDEQGE